MIQIANKVRIFLSIILAITSSSVFSQTIIPPAPNAAGLAQYTDVPVGTYTGTPIIDIPLYTIKSGDITVPISLSYHSGGIKVAQEASWVGLGWSLKAGGVISRSIRGKRLNGAMDDYPRENELPPHYLNNFPRLDTFEDAEEFADAYRQDDVEPDIFFYDFGGYSGKFFLEKSSDLDLSATIVKQGQNISIKYSSQENRWIAVDGLGINYFFEEVEQQFVLSDTKLHEEGDPSLAGPYFLNASPVPNVTSWYLTKIKSPKEDSIVFEYKKDAVDIQSMVQTASTRLYPGGESCVPLDLGNCFDCPATDPGCTPQGEIILGSPKSPRLTSHQKTITYTFQRLLERIVFENGSITFHTNNRYDLVHGALGQNPQTAQPQKLARISVNSLWSNEPIKEFEFVQSYFSRGAQTLDPGFARLKLDQLLVHSSANTETYSFAYNTLWESTIPSKTSKDIDHWGFFNNAGNDHLPPWGYEVGNSGTLIPTYTDTEFGTILGANRSSNEHYAQLFLLESITYPTGGTHSYEYELNDFKTWTFEGEGGGLRLKKSIISGEGVNPIIKKYLYTLENGNTSGRAMSSPSYFTKSSGLAGLATGSGGEIGMLISNPGISSIGCVLDCPTALRGNSEAYNPPNSSAQGSYIGYDRVIILQGEQGENGKEVIEYYNQEDANIMPPLDISPGVPYLANGLVKSKKIYDKNDNILRSESFDYSKYHGSTRYTKGMQVKQVDICPGCSWSIVYPAFYDIFSEWWKLDEKTTKEYFYDRDYSLLWVEKLAEGVTDYSYSEDITFTGEGKYLLSFEAKSTNSFWPVKLSGKAFDGDIEFEVGSAWRSHQLVFDKDGGPDHILRFDQFSYQFSLRNLKLEQLPKTNLGVTSEESYSYSVVNDIKLLTSTTTKHLNSILPTDDDNYETRLSYAINTTGLGSSLLSNRNMYEVTLRKEFFKNGVLLSKTETEFELVNNIPYPTIYRDYANGSEEGLRIVNNVFYDNGNLKMKCGQDGVCTTYIWGYDETLLIAKIVNSSIQDLSTYLTEISEAKSKSDLDNDTCSFGLSCSEANLRTSLQSLRNSIQSSYPYARVYTYTYDPLIGITSETDPNGVTNFYSYDDNNRLMKVSNDDGNVLQQIDYNYGN